VPANDELGYLIEEFRIDRAVKIGITKAMDINRMLAQAESGDREVRRRVTDLFMEHAREVATLAPGEQVSRYSDMGSRIKTIREQQRTGALPGVPTGIPSVDPFVRVIKAGDFFVQCGFSGRGKGLALDTPLPTPSGWTTMGEVEVGDTLFDEEGKPCRVTNTSPIRRLDCYRVKFSDGTELVADGDHLWQGFITKATTYYGKRAREAQDFRDVWDSTEVVDMRTIASNMAGGGAGPRIPSARPLDLPEADLPLDPYLLGVWLGDGDSRIGWISNPDDDIHDEIARRGYAIVDKTNQQRCRRYKVEGLTDGLRVLGLLQNKRVPDIYLRGSEQQRRDLLAGLLDTDGWAPAEGGRRVLFEVMSKPLAMGVRELAHSLGWKVSWQTKRAKLNGRDMGTVWRVSIHAGQQPFKLGFKAARWNGDLGQAKRCTRRTIVFVEPVDSVPTRCLSVDSSRSLYLATDAFIPTHNTQGLVRSSVQAYAAGDVVLMNSLEMSPDEIWEIYDAEAAKLSRRAIQFRDLSEQDYERYEMAAARVRAAQNDIVYVRAETVDKLAAMVERYGANTACVDYVSLMEGQRRASSDWERTKEVSQSLKKLAGHMNIRVYAAAQSNRDAALNGPTEDNIAHSTSIFSDCNVMIGWHQTPEMARWKQVQGRLVKNRNMDKGPPGESGYYEFKEFWDRDRMIMETWTSQHLWQAGIKGDSGD
jgi:replicative DNA helicase